MTFGGSMKFYKAGADGVIHEVKRMAGPGPEKTVVDEGEIRSERRQFDRRHQLRRESDEMAEQTPPDSPGCVLAGIDARVAVLEIEAKELKALRKELSAVQNARIPIKLGSGGTQPQFPHSQADSLAERALRRLLDKAVV